MRNVFAYKSKRKVQEVSKVKRISTLSKNP